MSDDLRRKGLGRGLSALLEEDPDDQATLDRLRSSRAVAVEQLEPGPFQPRRYFDDDELRSLVDSIVENGILQPILVRRHPDDPARYQIVAGERRWRAAQMASLHEVPVVLRELDDSQTLELAIIENIQRQDLTAIEEAEGYRRLMDEFGHTQEQLGQVVGKSRSHVANTLRLMNLPEEIRSLVHRGDLSAGHARALLMAEDAVGLAKQVLKDGLNVRQTEQLIQSPQRHRPPKQSKAKDADTIQLEKQLSERLGLKVVINHKGESGEVRIAYRSLEQFDDIFSRLTQSRAAPMVDAASMAEAEADLDSGAAEDLAADIEEPVVADDTEATSATAAEAASSDDTVDTRSEDEELSPLEDLDSAVAAIDSMLDDPLPAIGSAVDGLTPMRGADDAEDQGDEGDEDAETDDFSIYDEDPLEGEDEDDDERS